MILQNSFYTIAELATAPEQLDAVLTIDPAHDIFRGHFPGQPVVPGVCMVQIVRELMEQWCGRRLLLSKGQQLKFLQLLVPVRGEPVQIHISRQSIDEGYQVSATFKKNNEAICKLSGIFTAAASAI